MADQIDTRFGALDRCLAAAVRHALDVAVTFPALTLMNAVHLRLASMADIIAADFELQEPPTHRWHELMIELFGRNAVGTRRSPVSRYGGKPNAATLEHIEFGKSYDLNAREHSIIHDLLASAGAFIVAESISLHDIVEQWDLSGRDGFVVDDLGSVLQHAGQVGVRLGEAAKTSAWLDLLSDHGFDPPPVPVAKGRAVSPDELSSRGPIGDMAFDNVDPIVLLVEPMDDELRRALTARAIKTIRESVLRLGEERLAKQVVVVSAMSGQHSKPLPLAGWAPTGAIDDDGGGSGTNFDYMLDQVARTVDTFGQTDGRIATLETPTACSTQAEVVSELRPTLLIVLVNSASGEPPERLLPQVSIPGLSAGECLDADRIPRGHGRLPLSRASVVLISEWPLATTLGALVTSWCAVGARDLQYLCLKSTVPFVIPFADDTPESKPDMRREARKTMADLAIEGAARPRSRYWGRSSCGAGLFRPALTWLVVPAVLIFAAVMAGILAAELTIVAAGLAAVMGVLFGFLVACLREKGGMQPFRFHDQDHRQVHDVKLGVLRRR